MSALYIRERIKRCFNWITISLSFQQLLVWGADHKLCTTTWRSRTQGVGGNFIKKEAQSSLLNLDSRGWFIIWGSFFYEQAKIKGSPHWSKSWVGRNERSLDDLDQYLKVPLLLYACLPDAGENHLKVLYLGCSIVSIINIRPYGWNLIPRKSQMLSHGWSSWSNHWIGLLRRWKERAADSKRGIWIWIWITRRDKIVLSTHKHSLVDNLTEDYI
jgi:hypothetical protein